MKGFLKVLVVVVGVMVVSGCGGYNSKLSQAQWEPKKLTNDNNVKVFVKSYHYNSCTGSAIAIVRFCREGQFENYIVKEIENAGITVVDSIENSNVVVDTIDVEFGRHATGFKTTTKLRLNAFEITIISKVYNTKFWHTFDDSDSDSAFITTSKVIAKLIKKNVVDNAEIEIKVSVDGGTIVEFKDNTGL